MNNDNNIMNEIMKWKWNEIMKKMKMKKIMINEKK